MEAVFEFFVEEPSGWSEASSDRLEQNLAVRFSGERDVVQPFALQLQLGPARPVGPLLAPEPPRRRLWSPDKGELFQFGRSMCAYNLLARYTRFEQHVEAISELAASYLAEVRPQSIAWAGQRYINKVLVPLGKGNPASYFELFPRLPRLVAHRPFAIQVVSGEFENGQTVLNLTYQGEHEGSAAYVLDIYARSVKPLKPEASVVRRWHEVAHPSVREAFESALTQETKALFDRGGP